MVWIERLENNGRTLSFAAKTRLQETTKEEQEEESSFISILIRIFGKLRLQTRSQQLSGFYTFADTPKEYYDQLFAVYWAKETDRSGHIKTVRKMKRSRGDHYFDCECMARALSKFLGIARVDRLNTQPIGEPKKRKPKKPQQNNRTSSFW